MLKALAYISIAKILISLVGAIWILCFHEGSAHQKTGKALITTLAVFLILSLRELNVLPISLVNWMFQRQFENLPWSFLLTCFFTIISFACVLIIHRFIEDKHNALFEGLVDAFLSVILSFYVDAAYSYVLGKSQIKISEFLFGYFVGSVAYIAYYLTTED